MITVLRSSAHAHPQWRGCGGGRRSAQIEDILRRHGITWQDEFTSPAPTRLQLLRAACRLRFGSPSIRLRGDRRLVQYLADDYLRHRWYFARHPKIRVFLIEECTDYARICAAHDAGVGLICLPHNFETLQQTPPRDFYSGEPAAPALMREVAFTALGDVVFCLSREEQWLLANFGATTDYLPYHPPETDLPLLRRIREHRQAHPAPTGELAVIISGHNPRNREGLLVLRDWLRQLAPNDALHLHIAGQGLDSWRERLTTPQTTFHGEVDGLQWEQLMQRCHAVVVHQVAGAGVLTRIAEALCAGVPVLANPHAARSAYHRPGVHLYHDVAELAELARQPLPFPPAPEPDRAAEQRLITWIRRLAEPKAD